MCEQDQFEKDRQEYEARGLVTRRQFGVLVGAGMTMMLPRVVGAVAVTESDVTITTPDGTADCYFVHPASGTVARRADLAGHLRPAAGVPADGQAAGRIGLCRAGGQSVLPRQEGADGGSGRRDADRSGEAARAGAERNDADDRREGVHRLAGPAVIGCEEQEGRHAGLLHGRSDGVSDCRRDARPDWRGRLVPWGWPGHHGAEQPAHAGGGDQAHSSSSPSRRTTTSGRPTTRRR